MNAFWQMVRTLMGWRSVSGLIVRADPAEAVRQRIRWSRVIVALVVVTISGTLLVPILFGVLLTGLVVRLLLSTVRGARAPGMPRLIAVHALGHALGTRLHAARRMIPAHNYRLLEATGRVHLIRVEGEMPLGAMAVGDNVIAEGGCSKRCGNDATRYNLALPHQDQAVIRHDSLERTRCADVLRHHGAAVLTGCVYMALVTNGPPFSAQ